MALRKRGERGNSMIWPGFVDAMTALLLVLMFVLSIFMIVQFVLSEELTGKDRTLDRLTSELGLLSDQLSLARSEAESAQAEITNLSQLLQAEREQALSLAAALEDKTTESEALSAQLSAKIAELAATASALEGREARLTELESIVVSLREERAQYEERAASLAAIEDENEQLRAQVAEVRARLAEAENQAQDTELTLNERIAALQLALDRKRQEAEETLILLAAAEEKQKELSEEAIESARQMSRQEQAAALARATLAGQEKLSEQSRLAVALLNAQIRQLRERIGLLNDQLDESEAKDEENQVVIANLGARLNQALAQKVGELQRYRSEFFGRMREILGDRQDIRIVGDRFVFQSEVLFQSGSADLGEVGQRELSKFGAVLREVSARIPDEINWIMRVDGHTDIVPIGRTSEYDSNWELSQARALSVVEFLIDVEGIAPSRLAAAGFGEFQPLDPGRSSDALARNRRIELKFTER